MNIRDGVQSIMRVALNDARLVIWDGMSAKDRAEWDSLAQINIVVAAESRFGVRFTTQELYELANVGELIAAIERKLAVGLEGQ